MKNEKKTVKLDNLTLDEILDLMLKAETDEEYKLYKAYYLENYIFQQKSK